MLFLALVILFTELNLWTSAVADIEVLLAIGLVLFWLRLLLIRRISGRLRLEILTEAPGWDRDPIATNIAALWKRPTLPPDGSEIHDLIGRFPPEECETGMVICLGVTAVPSAGDYRFEPEVITPGRRWREILPGVGTTMILLLMSFFCLGDWLVRSLGERLAAIVFFAALVLGAALSWIGPFLLWPKYVRLAPAVVQSLSYGFRRSRPTLRSYPMKPGTVAVVTNEIGPFRCKLSLTMVRGDERIELAVWKLGEHERAIERMWQALLSTAPTPPLSDEELVG